MTTFNERAQARQAAAQRNAKPLTGIAAGMLAGSTADDDEAEKLIVDAMTPAAGEGDDE